MSGKKILNAFDMAPPRSIEVKPYGVGLKPGQRLDVSGRIINERSVQKYAMFRVDPAKTLEEKVTRAIRTAQNDAAYRIARKTGKK